ncbi:multidrug DMT transporter permease [Pueribacillus theae]|uniref:Multidrug DMT transporter permease n=1 Tax=Pueribacillus theae TaxID=2171751 RepID=A0A2U1JV00_9BACI|nr:DMT family transporter [Pueribacillus theae]PWA08779.1 multidrug DMT transporter permease [Pueribacillus theae]
MTRWQASFIFTIGAGLFGFTPIFVKLHLAAGYTLSKLIVSQMIIAATILWLIACFKKKKLRLTRKTILSLMLAGTLNGITGIFYYNSMKYVPASVAIVLLFQFVWVGVLYEWILDKRRPTLPTYVTVVLTLIGVLFAANIFTDDFSNLPFLGILFGLISAFTYAGFIFVSGRVATQTDPLLRAPLMITGSLILVLIVFRPAFLFTDEVFHSFWLYGLGGALFGAVFPPLCFSISAPHLPSSLATILGSVELPVAVVAASIILSEQVTVLQWFGIVLILFAISFNEIRSGILHLIDKKKSNVTE